MRLSKGLTILASCAALLTCNAFAQVNEAPAAAPATTSSKAAMRAENRQTVRSVRRALDRTKGLQVSDIGVSAKAGAVALSGSVPDASQIALAGSVAAAAPSVKSVNNQLTVRFPGAH